MAFDLQFETKRFVDLLPEFEDHGMVVFQMDRKVSGSLFLDRIPDEAIDRVLIQNGLHLRFYLPHAMEVAVVGSPFREPLEKALHHPEVRRLAYEAR